MLEDDGKYYSQGASILRMLGKRYGYYPEDPIQAWRVDSTGDAMHDLMEKFISIKFQSDEEKKKAQQQDFLTNFFPKWLSVFEKRLNENTSKDYLVGDKITNADFNLGYLINSIIYNDASEYSAVLKDIFE